MRTLRDLPATWENWSSRRVTRRALASAHTAEQEVALRAVLDQSEVVDPLDALRDAAELVTLLNGWRWQAMEAARESGASWEQIADASRMSATEAEHHLAEAVENQQRHGLWRPGTGKGR